MLYSSWMNKKMPYLNLEGDWLVETLDNKVYYSKPIFLEELFYGFGFEEKNMQSKTILK